MHLISEDRQVYVNAKKFIYRVLKDLNIMGNILF